MEHTKGKLSLNNYRYPHAYLVIRKGSEDNDAFPRPRKICDVTLEGKTEEEYEANAEHLVKCWNSHDALYEACKEIDHFFTESMGQILTSEQALKSYNNSTTKEKVKQALAKAEGKDNEH